MIKAALPHVVRNRVEAAYARSNLFERGQPVRAAAYPDGRLGALPGPRDQGRFQSLRVKSTDDPAGGVEDPVALLPAVYAIAPDNNLYRSVIRLVAVQSNATR